MRKLFPFIFLILIGCTNSGKEKWDDYQDGWSPLMIFIYNDETEEFTELLKENVDVNFVSESKYSHWHLTAIEVAIFKENDFAIKKILSTGKVSHPEKFLMLACEGENANIVSLLIKYGANPNETLDNGHSVTMSASSFGSTKVLECLLKNGANPNKTRFIDGMSALMFATINAEPEKVKLLLNYGAKKETKDLNGKTALDYVDDLENNSEISRQNIDGLRELLKTKTK
jgi:ankyrin repeat protein